MHQPLPRVIHPVAILAAWILLAFGLQALWPLESQTLPYLRTTGRLLAVGGGVLLIWSHIAQHQHGTSPELSQPTSALVTSGPYRISRNPIYLSFLLILGGLAVASGRMWAVLLLVPLAMALHFLTVLREERHLEQMFPSGFSHYRATTRRWL
jgi:protein-S-isoprenylcysteine O-methyltransferase Ste14